MEILYINNLKDIDFINNNYETNNEIKNKFNNKSLNKINTIMEDCNIMIYKNENIPFLHFSKDNKDYIVLLKKYKKEITDYLYDKMNACKFNISSLSELDLKDVFNIDKYFIYNNHIYI